MSDVWQGPGWWLASDGKWYPAEAESGAVFDGDIEGSSDDAAATEPEVAEPASSEPVEEAAADETVEAEPVQAEAVEAEAVEAEPAAPSSGGWQIDDTVDAEVDAADDGWSSGFGDSSAAVVADTTPVEETEAITTFAEPVTVSGLETPVVETPEFEVPDIDMLDTPDLGGISGMDVPGIEIPDIDMPDVGGISDINMPPAPDLGDISDIDVPGIDIPDAPAAPDIDMPDTPDLGGISGMDVPGIDIPDAPTAPNVDMPDATDVTDSADIEIPDFTVSETLKGSPFDKAPPLSSLSGADPAPDGADSIPTRDTTPDTASAGLTASDMDLLRGDLPEEDQSKIDVPEPPKDPEPSIERTDAWRSPGKTDAIAASTVASTSGRPEVVDLAIPEQKPTPEVETSDRNWGLIGGGVAVVLLIAAIVWLASLLFSDGDTSETANNDDEVAAPIEEETQSEEPAEDGSTGDFVSVFDLRQGDCIRGDIAGQILEVERVDCAESHDFEVYVERLIDDSVITEYDEAIVTDFSEGVCRSALAELVSPAENPTINFKFLQPTQDSWNSDAQDRLVTCLGFDEEGPLEGRFDDE